MKKYKWVVNNSEKSKAEAPILVDEQFEDITKMKINCSEISERLKEKLKEHRVEVLARTQKDGKTIIYFELVPTAVEQIFFGAPLYSKRNGEYYLLSTFFSGKAYVPRDFETIKEEYEKCKKEMENEKE